uniref:Uncharacterized protein MANES_15G016600 n=1 Tax=Rhizophora mucronata TaxID=61149 RepID=A0A2P2JSV7_RHIMU
MCNGSMVENVLSREILIPPFFLVLSKLYGCIIIFMYPAYFVYTIFNTFVMPWLVFPGNWTQAEAYLYVYKQFIDVVCI